MGFLCISKSANLTRIRENDVVDDWELAPEEMKELVALDREFRYRIGYSQGHFDFPNAPW